MPVSCGAMGDRVKRYVRIGGGIGRHLTREGRGSLSSASPNRGEKLLAVAMAALAIIFKSGYRYKKAGITFLELVPAGRVQDALFDRPDDGLSISRMRVVDRLNTRFGRGTIGFGTSGERQVWSLKREFVSPRYTTDWNELLRV